MFPPVSKWLHIFSQIAAHPQNNLLLHYPRRASHIRAASGSRCSGSTRCEHGSDKVLRSNDVPADKPRPSSPPQPTRAVSWVGARIKWKDFDQNSLPPFQLLPCTCNPLSAGRRGNHEYVSLYRTLN